MHRGERICAKTRTALEKRRTVCYNGQNRSREGVYGRKKEDAARLFVRGARRRVLGRVRHGGTVSLHLSGRGQRMADRGADVSGRRGAARRRARKAPPTASSHLVGPARRAAARALLRRWTDDLPIYLPRSHPLLQQRDRHSAAVYGAGTHFALGVPACAQACSPAPSRSARRCARRSGCTRASRGRIFSALLPFW